MPNGRTILLISLSVFLSLYESAHAESAKDRIALMLSGPDCASSQQTVAAALQQHTGVLHVDPDLMPDHILIDVLRPHLTEDELAILANQSIGTHQCRAEIMKSCITAGPSDHHTDRTHPAEGLAQSH